MKRGDATLRHDVEEALPAEPGVDDARARVTARDGGLTLTGGEPSYGAKRLAERTALRVAGVRALNTIEVQLRDRGRADEDFARVVSQTLRWHRQVPAEVQAVVRDGGATLQGVVDWGYQRRAAEERVRNLAASPTRSCPLRPIRPRPRARGIQARSPHPSRDSRKLPLSRIRRPQAVDIAYDLLYNVHVGNAGATVRVGPTAGLGARCHRRRDRRIPVGPFRAVVVSHRRCRHGKDERSSLGFPASRRGTDSPKNLD